MVNCGVLVVGFWGRKVRQFFKFIFGLGQSAAGTKQTTATTKYRGPSLRSG
jgi:hypothetical protein